MRSGVLRLIGGGRTNSDIAAELYLGKARVGRLFAKLGVRDGAHAVIAAYERGLVQPGGRPA